MVAPFHDRGIYDLLDEDVSSLKVAMLETKSFQEGQVDINRASTNSGNNGDIMNDTSLYKIAESCNPLLDSHATSRFIGARSFEAEEMPIGMEGTPAIALFIKELSIDCKRQAATQKIGRNSFQYH